MTLLREATMDQAAAKIAIFGPQGAGKSLTSALLAIALSKTFHNSAPVSVMDTEPAWDWLLPIFQVEGVKLLRHKGRAFTDMQTVHRESLDAGACAFVVDSYGHPWGEVQESLKKKLNVRKLEFHHQQQLQELWGAWVREFLASPLHILLAGRLAYEWENDVDDETGKIGFHKAGTKMRAEKDAGYEPHLLLEMEAVRIMEEIERRKVGTKVKTTRRQKKAGGSFIHRLHVLKDRARGLNGKMFEFKDINDYKAGGWKPVFDALKPHFAAMNIGGAHAGITERTSANLFDGQGDSAFQRRARRVQITLEEIQGTLVKLWPGQDAKSKSLKQLAIETLFATRSWTAVEGKSLEALEAAMDTFKLFEERVEDGQSDAVSDTAPMVALLQMCRDRIADEAKRAEETVDIL